MSELKAIATRLENYTLKFPQELLMIQAHIEDEADVIIVFKGFSSSLVRPTAFDPEVPILPDNAAISRIDRLKGPYQPQSPDYIEQDISLEAFIAKLTALGL
ncbi:MAG: hypothetical protein WBA76_00605 [Phormidesmis sp.]